MRFRLKIIQRQLHFLYRITNKNATDFYKETKVFCPWLGHGVEESVGGANPISQHISPPPLPQKKLFHKNLEKSNIAPSSPLTNVQVAPLKDIISLFLLR